MKMPIWYENVAAANPDVNAPGVEWAIVPIITEVMLQHEAQIGQYIDDVLLERHNTMTKAVHKMLLAQTKEHAAVQAVIEMSAIVGDVRKAIRKEIEEQREELFDTYLQVRAEIAEANHVDSQIRENKETA